MFNLGRFWLFEPTTQNANAFEDVDGEKIIKVFDVGGGGEIEDEGGQGAPFKKLSYASELKNIQKGGKNKIKIRPRVLIENMIDDTNDVKELGAGGVTDVGQIFKLTGGIKTLDRIHLTLEAIAGGAIQLIDDFESFADTAALRGTWVPNDTTNSPNILETSIFQEGSQAMKCDLLNKQKSKNDSFIKTFGSNQDWSTFNGIQFQFRNDGNSVIEIHIEDSSGDASKQTITVSNQGVFEFNQLDFADFVPVATISADLSSIKKIKFFVKTAVIAPFYIDIIELFSSQSFGTVDVELHDFGTDGSPTQLVTPTQTETISLESGKKIYEIPFEVENLTPNNFFGIVITNASAATVKVFGKSGSDLYTNGFAFSSTNDLDIASTGSGDDLFFLTFALDKAIFNGIRFVANGDTGQGKINVFINDNASGKGKSALFLGETFLGRTEIDFPTKTQTNLGVKMGKDELILIDYEDDAGSLVTKLQATVYFTFIKRNPNG